MSASGVPKLTDLLSAEDMARVAAAANRRKYRDGEIIHERGDRDGTIGVVVAGRIKLTYPRHDGSEIFSGLIHIGQNFGDAALLHGEARPHRAVASGDTAIDHIGRPAFDKLLKHSTIAHAFYVVATFRLSVTLGLLDDMRTLNPSVRLARLLARMRQANPVEDRLQFLQEDFAGMLGVSTVTLAKALRELSGQGLIEPGYRHIRINDGERLLAWIDERDPG